jgi:polyferredoxin
VKAPPRPGLWRPRALVYGSLLLATVVALGLGLLQRPTLRMDAMRDRAVLAREVEDGAIENTYQVLLLNARDGERAAALQVVADPALPGLTVVSDPRVRLPAADSQTVLLRLRLPAEAAQRLRGRILPVTLQARTLEPAPEAARTRTTFVLPR